MCELLQTIIKARSPLIAPVSMNVKLEEKKTDWSPLNKSLLQIYISGLKRNYEWVALFSSSYI